MKSKNALFSFMRAMLPGHLRGGYKPKEKYKPPSPELAPVPRDWWNAANIAARQKALRKMGFKKKRDLNFLSDASYADVFGGRNPMPKKKKSKKKATRRKSLKRTVKRRTAPRIKNARRRASVRRRKAVARPRPVVRRRKKNSVIWGGGSNATAKKTTRKVTFPFSVTPVQKKKLAGWVSRTLKAAGVRRNVKVR